MASRESTLLIGCAALAREIAELGRLNRWDHVAVEWLPADLHNRPDQIPDAVAEKIEQARDRFEQIVVAYGDCGTGGRLDAILEKYSVRRLEGDHCYAFFAGPENFVALHEAEPGTFYLTDFLVRNFDRLVIRGLGLDRHPELHSSYFGNYRRIIYLAQIRSDDLEAKARACANQLGLAFEYRFTGLAPLDRAIAAASQEASTLGEEIWTA